MRWLACLLHGLQLVAVKPRFSGFTSSGNLGKPDRRLAVVGSLLGGLTRISSSCVCIESRSVVGFWRGTGGNVPVIFTDDLVAAHAQSGPPTAIARRCRKANWLKHWALNLA